MKTTHAFNFVLVGLAMCFGPAIWPQQFSSASSSTNTSELWLLIMGVTQAVMGAWALGLNEVPRLSHQLAAWEPVKLDFALPDVGWTLTESFYAGLVDDEEVNVALALQQQLRLGQA